MKAVTTSVSTSLAAEQSAPVELYDIYLKAAINTPAGVTNVIRICTLPDGLNFFTPTSAPEPSGTRGAAANYYFWPIKRDVLKTAAKFQNDKLTFAASNISGDYSSMLAAVDWKDCPVVIRHVNASSAGLIADDCILLYSGKIDTVRLDLKQVQFTCSNGLGTFNYSIPNEFMHSKCRFSWGDDMCTAIRFLSSNYKSKTAGSGSSTTRVLSSGLTEDTSQAPWSLEPCTVNTSTEYISLVSGATLNMNGGDKVMFSADVMPGGLTAGVWYYVCGLASAPNAWSFQVSNNEFGGPAINITSSGTNLKMTSLGVYGPDKIRALSNAAITTSSETGGITGVAATFVLNNVFLSNGATAYVFRLASGILNLNQQVKFAASGSMPGGLIAGVYYFAVPLDSGLYGLSFTLNGPVFNVSSTGSGVTATTALGGQGYQVKAGDSGFWLFSNPADWGTLVQGYWTLTDAQAGLKNPGLTPWIQFDLGTATKLGVWRIRSLNIGREFMVRTIVIFSSSNGTSWKFESYYELPPIGAQMFDIPIATAATNRYWRICVRSMWTSIVPLSLFERVDAHAVTVNWWRDGRVTFDAATTTVALRGVSRRVLASYGGQLVVEDLPVAPAAGDVFVVERDCGKTFNDCCARLNTENFGGFDSMPSETVVQ